MSINSIMFTQNENELTSAQKAVEYSNRIK